jgi:signal transduction histidine kinase
MELRPSLLDDLGLPTAIEWQAGDFQKRSGIRCQVRIRCGDDAVDREVATAVFRIFQETLTNIIRHAKATECRVSLTKNDKELCLEVTDNGIGITQWQIDNPRSFGMIGMRERAHLWGGAVHVRNIRPSGTNVRVVIPLGRGEEE